MIALAAALALFAAPVLPATAAEDAPPAVRWSVSPADESGPDGRTAAEHTLDPGEAVDDRFAVRNVSEESVTFSLTAADGFYTRTGRFDILPSDQESVDSGTWIDLPESVTVPAGETVVVPYTITVPDRAEPGDHAAGITASILSVQSSDDGTNVGVESRVGFRVLTRVTGEIAPAVSLGDLTGDYTTSWNPFRPGEATVSFEVTNDGNTRVMAEGSVEAGGQSTVFPAEDGIQQELLPGDSRVLTVEVNSVWPLFAVPATVTLDATSVPMDGTETALEPVSAEIVVWAVPWPQLAILLGLLLLVGAIVWGRIRSRRRIEALIESAREEGRRAATAPVEVS